MRSIPIQNIEKKTAAVASQKPTEEEKALSLPPSQQQQQHDAAEDIQLDVEDAVEEALKSRSSEEEREEKENEGQINFGAADFGLSWRSAQLAQGPPATIEALQALREDIALLEAALELCDIMPCADEAAAARGIDGVVVASQQQQQQQQQQQGRKASRKLSELASGQQPQHHQQHKENLHHQQQQQQEAQPPLAASPSDVEDPLNDDDFSKSAGGGAGDTTAKIPPPAAAAAAAAGGGGGSGGGSGRSVKRRRLERQMAVAEAAAEQALRTHHNPPPPPPMLLDRHPKHRGKQQNHRHAAIISKLTRLDFIDRIIYEEREVIKKTPTPHRQSFRRPRKDTVSVGSSIHVVWKEGTFLGLVLAFDAETGMHEIGYDDGDVQWHDLDEEQWWRQHHNDDDDEEEDDDDVDSIDSIDRIEDKSEDDEVQVQVHQEKDKSSIQTSPSASVEAVAAVRRVEEDAVGIVLDSQMSVELLQGGTIEKQQQEQQGSEKEKAVIASDGAIPFEKEKEEEGEEMETQKDGAGHAEVKGFVLASQLPLHNGSEEEEEEGKEDEEILKQRQQKKAQLKDPFSLSYPAPAATSSPAIPPPPPHQQHHHNSRQTTNNARPPQPPPPPPLQHHHQRAGNASLHHHHHRRSTNSSGNSAHNSSDIRALLLSQNAAEAALKSAPMYLAIVSKNAATLQATKTLQEALPNVFLHDEVCETTTHVIVETNDSSIATKRSKGYLQGLARGCWVVSTAWLEACADTRSRVKEQLYQVKGFVLKDARAGFDALQAEALGGPERCRALAKEGKKLFTGMCFRLKSVTLPGEKPALHHLVLSLLKFQGGAIVEEGKNARGVIVVTSDKTVVKGFLLRKLPVVDPRWVLDSVSCCKCLPMSNYARLA